MLDQGSILRLRSLSAFVSLAHSDDIIDRTIEAARKAFATLER